MSIIKNEDNIKYSYKSPKYELPAVIRPDEDEISFEKSVGFSLTLHVIAFLLALATSFVLKYFGINFDMFNKPDMLTRDIEFVLVEKEGTPIDKNTKNRADKDSRAGGEHDPNRPVSIPQTPAPKGPEKKPTPLSPKVEAPKPQAKPQTKPQAQPQQSKPQPQAQPQQQAPAKPAPKPTAPKPTTTPSVPKPTAKPTSNFNIPIPKSSIPQMAQPSTAPVTSAPAGTSGGSAKGTGSPSPSFSPSTSAKIKSAYSGGGGGGRFSNGNGNGGSNAGNPGPGNPQGAPGIDAIKEPDFGPYMKELQRRIKMNWDPPKGNESKRVILLFTIAHDGRLLNVSVHKSSGLQAADKAAIDAVKLTAPFRPLPPEYRNDSVDIQFTFDYNVFGVNTY